MPFERPVTVQLPVAGEPLGLLIEHEPLPPLKTVTAKLVGIAPADAVTVTVALLLPDTAEIVGAAGGPMASPVDAGDAPEVPAALVAVAAKE